MSTSVEILNKYWGYSSFRPLQEDIIDCFLGRRDCIALLPTGGGKSLCYQVPAVKSEGITIVISPLLSLMADQVNSLRKKGIKVLAVNSFMSRNEIDKALDNAIFGNYKLLYVSPERLQTEIFIERFKRMNVSQIAVDEAHCISQWGYDFRPSYLKIGELRQYKDDLTFLALTATATSKVVDDITNCLGMEKPEIFKQSFSRKNLRFLVRETGNKFETVLKWLKKVDGSSIIYARNRRKCQELSEILQQSGVNAMFYHAGLGHEERQHRQEEWSQSREAVMVATNAFGMGIDKPDVRLVIHWDLPDSLEAFYQEAGRAGRDGVESHSITLFGDPDILKLERGYNQSFPSKVDLKNVYNQLGNYFKIPAGEGREMNFTFDIGKFSEIYKTDRSLAYYCLKQLEQESYIALSEAFYQPAQIHILALKVELNLFMNSNPAYREMIRFLLRAYSGILEGFVRIDEKQIQKSLDCTATELNTKLKYLIQTGIIDYREQQDEPLLTFLTDRIQPEQFKLSTEFNRRKEAYRKRMDSVIDYVKTEDKCRMQIILEYFDEVVAEPCGKCDYCSMKTADLNESELLDFYEKLKAELKKNQGMGLGEIEELFPDYRPKLVSRCCRLLCERELLLVNDHKISLNSKIRI